MTQTPPAADGGLPGLATRDAMIKRLDAEIERLDALLAEKDALIVSQAMQIKGHGATISRQSKAHGETIRQLATATERLASAEVAVSGILDAVTNEIDLSKRSPMFVRAIKGLRAWLTSKDGEKQP